MVAGLAWRRRPAAGAGPLAVTMLSMVLWAWAYALFWIALSGEVRLFWLSLALLGVVLSSPAFFVMSLKVTGNSHLLTRKVYTAICILPALIFFMLWTDSLFGLFWGDVDVFNPDDFMMGGLGYSLVMLHGLFYTAVSIYFLVRSYKNSSHARRKQVVLIIIGILFPILAFGLRIFGVSPFPMLDITPVAFTLSGIIFAYGMFSHRIMDLAPMGRAMVMEKLDDGVVVLDHFDRVVDINRKAFLYMLPHRQRYVGEFLKDLYPEWDLQIDKHNLLEIFTIRIELERLAGHVLDLTVTPLLDENADLLGRLLIWHDITHQKMAEDQLRTFFLAVAQSPSAIMIINVNEKIEYVNERFEKLTGYTKDEVLHESPRLLQSGKMPAEFYENMLQTLRGGKPWQGELINKKKNGDLYWEDQYIAPVINQFGEITHYVAIKQDASERKQNEGRLWLANENLKLQLSEIERLHAQLREEAIRDDLTRLFNRRYMEQSLERELARASREGIQISVVMMDVDNFKSINDTYGHFAGDMVLQSLGDLLLKSIRSTDLACRYGGDEVVVLLMNAPLDAGYARADEWRVEFSNINFDFEGRTAKVSLSLGVASFPAHGKVPSELINAADKALYMAKVNKNTVAKYSLSH